MLVVTCVAMAMFLVKQRSETRKLGYECGALQRRAVQLDEENRRLLSEVCILKAPQFLVNKVLTMELGLKDSDSQNPAVSQARPDGENPKREAAMAALRQRHGMASSPAPHPR